MCNVLVQPGLRKGLSIITKLPSMGGIGSPPDAESLKPFTQSTLSWERALLTFAKGPMNYTAASSEEF